ncbi:hypothetical protein QGX11_gp105 [Pseudomonas phage PPSC2]|uniref:Uncharacterized protein n=1 Tax=Pseudomonas phage PPSC2 TaxID=2041350 RepID=A0A2R2YAR8_9CAUD|nr:hypothetical protein QGX11_gp105 [Pseudomonas phage PPSC2]ATN92868.1 hypothetical protein PPSC2_105 [Pseudomonas phage PPSC2]
MAIQNVRIASHQHNVTTQRAYIMERYFIRNCLGQIVGNPKGYVTYKGANMIFNRQKMQVELIDLAHAEKVKGSVGGAVMIGSIKLEKVGPKVLTVVRVETKDGHGMYNSVWFECSLPCDDNHPTIEGDSLYKDNLRKYNDERGVVSSYYGEPEGHRFGFLDLVMLRRWIYNDKWLTAMSNKGAVICTYEVPVESVIVGRTQVTFDFEKAVCLDRKPLASVLEQA